MFNLNIRQYLDVILSDRQFDWLLSKFFEIQLKNLPRISKLSVLKETIFSELRIFSYYFLAIDEIQKEGLIEKTMADLTKQTLWKIFNNLDEYIDREVNYQKKFYEYEIEDLCKFIKFFHLALLITFKKIQLLGRKKRQKLLFLFAEDEKRRKAIEIMSGLFERENIEYKSIFEQFIIYPAYSAPEFAVANFGMYDKTMNNYVNITLIRPNYVSCEITKNGTIYLQLTDRGRTHIKELLKKDKDFMIFVKIAKQLQPFFDDMTGNELIGFIKKYIIPDWDEKRFWSQLK
ncbi:MAG TPA: hypothetical protein VMV49_09415 [Candidatus Deferrimicrobium sp.]|nr:hypothetical protein [Candidatus Deferrimicrobium sp.]